jgi:hypothetical protein
MIASNILRGYARIAHWETLAESDALLLDVREPKAVKKVQGAG